jgi:hypothetical protein
MGFRPLQRIGLRKRPAPGLPHPAVLRSQVFSTSQRFIPPRAVPVLFHTGSTHGVWDPTECSPPADRVASRLPIPSWRCSLTENAATVAGLHFHVRALAFTGLVPAGVRSYDDRCYPHAAADTLMGFIPFKVFPLFVSEDAFTTSSSYALWEEPLRRKTLTTYHRVSKNEEIGLSPRRLPTFLGFAPSAPFTILRCLLSRGLWIRLEARGTSPPPDHFSSGWVRTDLSET